MNAATTLGAGQIVLVRALRVGVVGAAAWWLAGISPGDDTVGALMSLSFALAAATLAWWLVPAFARSARRATLPGHASTPRAWLALPFLVLGVWYVGSGAADLFATPYYAITLRAIAGSAESAYVDRIWEGLVPSMAANGLRIASGLALVLGAGRLAAWVAPMKAVTEQAPE